MSRMMDLYLKDPSIYSIFIVSFVFLFSLARGIPSKVIEKIIDRRKIRSKKALELIESGMLTEEANSFLREYVEKSSFLMCYGISADAEMRDALIRYRKKHQDDIDWHDLRRAYPRIRLRDGNINVKIGRFDQFAMLFINFAALFFFVSSIFLFVISFFEGFPLYISIPELFLQIN